MPTKVRKFYTVDEAAVRFRVHRETVYRWVRASQIRVLRIGTTISIPANQFIQLAKENEHATPGASAFRDSEKSSSTG
jgi:excisionase family DNA binding protein